MTGERGTLDYRQLRAPAADLGALVEPTGSRWRASFAANRERLVASDRQHWAGTTLGELRRSAREQLLVAARRHTGQYRTLEACLADPTFHGDNRSTAYPPVVLTGHQPQLFHPGVWFKNFVLAALARQVAAPAVNLIIDNDTIRAAAVRVPRGVSQPGSSQPGSSQRGAVLRDGSQEDAVPLNGDSHAWAAMVEFDRPGDEVPFEERAVLDADRFRAFPRAVRAELASELPDPLVDSLWPIACAAMADTDRLGLCLSRARNVIESQAGVPILDVPLSTVCDAWPFRWFAVGLLEEGERFRDVHNAVLADYRRAHRIRSRSHPVPELARDGEWYETPFWLWSSDSPRRRRLFARRLPETLELTDRAGWRSSLARTGDGDASRAVEQLADARRQGVKLRPRALLTTLFARLLLSDQFIHGIGGAKYDQLTDAIFERFLGLNPPEFITATATLRLPLQLPPNSPSHSPPHSPSHSPPHSPPHSPLDGPSSPVFSEDGATVVRRLVERLRALRFHPESLLSESELANDEVARLAAEKRRWLETELPRGSRLARHRALGALNEALHQVVRHRESGWLLDLAAARRDERRRSLLRSREFSYAIFPKNWLLPRLLELAAPSS
jgi:hypothetical protein